MQFIFPEADNRPHSATVRFHVKKQCFPEGVFNVDTRKITQLCSSDLCNAGFAKKRRAVLNLFSVLAYENSHKFAALFLAAAGLHDASCS